MNRYVEIRQAFQYLECATRLKQIPARCGSLPDRLGGRRGASALRDYIYGQMLVALIAQLEFDITLLRVPGVRGAGLATKLQILRDHFSISQTVYDSVDRIREARNGFVHDGAVVSGTGGTKAELPGHIVEFLRRCNHADYA